MKHICVIDPAVKEPATPCFNQLMERYPALRFSYHLPALMGAASLSLIDPPDAILILGSASFVGEKLVWQTEIFNYVRDMLFKGIPTLGVCFGHQLVAQGFGAAIQPVFEDNRKLAGVRNMKFNVQLGSIPAGAELAVAINHRQEIKELPSDFEALASSDAVKYEMIRHRTLPFWGIQGHPEASVFFMMEYIGGLNSDEMARAAKGGQIFLNNFFRMTHIAG